MLLLARRVAPVPEKNHQLCLRQARQHLTPTPVDTTCGPPLTPVRGTNSTGPAPPILYFRRADTPLMNRGDAAAGTWIFRGAESQRRRGAASDRQRRRAGEGIRSRGEVNGGYSVEPSRVAAAAAAWID